MEFYCKCKGKRLFPKHYTNLYVVSLCFGGSLSEPSWLNENTFKSKSAKVMIHCGLTVFYLGFCVINQHKCFEWWIKAIWKIYLVFFTFLKIKNVKTWYFQALSDWMESISEYQFSNLHTDSPFGFRSRLWLGHCCTFFNPGMSTVWRMDHLWPSGWFCLALRNKCGPWVL